MMKYILVVSIIMGVFACNNKNGININGRGFKSVSLFSSNDTLTGCWCVSNDTLFYATTNFKKTYTVYPFLILKDTHSININPVNLNQPLTCINSYRITVDRIERIADDSVFYFNHRKISELSTGYLFGDKESKNYSEKQKEEIFKFANRKEFIYSTKRGFIGFKGYKVYGTESFCFPYENR